MEDDPTIDWFLPPISPAIYSGIINLMVFYIKQELERRFMVVDDLDIDYPYIIFKVINQGGQKMYLNAGELIDTLADFSDYYDLDKLDPVPEKLKNPNAEPISKEGIESNVERLIQQYFVIIDLFDSDYLKSVYNQETELTIGGIKAEMNRICNQWSYDLTADDFNLAIEDLDSDYVELDWAIDDTHEDYSYRMKLRQDVWEKVFKEKSVKENEEREKHDEDLVDES